MLNYTLDKFAPCSYQETAKSPDGTALPINVYLPNVENYRGETAVVCS